jgi:Uma2 family endonuclease
MGYRAKYRDTIEPQFTVSTAEQLYGLPKYPPHELYQGRLRICQPGAMQSSNTGLFVGALLIMHVRANKLGEAFGPDCGYVLCRNPDTVVAPDASFIAAKRLTYVRFDRFFEGAPDFAIEVASPSDRLIALRRKAALYIASGTRLVWIIDPATRKAIICQPGHDIEIVTGDVVLDATNVVRGFTCRLQDLFSTTAHS